MTTKIKAAAYYRMSSDKQETSIADQRTAVKEYAVKHGYKIIREYLDEGISGWKSEQRKGFQKLIADATDRGDFRAVLCWDQDRFSRFDPLEANHYWYLLDRADVQLATVGQGAIDWHSLGGWLSASIAQHGKAEFVRDLARNTTRGLRRRKLAGGWIGGVPVGYKLQAGRLTLGEPGEVALVRRIFDLRIKGYGVSSIANRLNGEGIASPKGAAWCARSVRHILDRKTYLGDSVIGGEHSRGRYDRVATESTTLPDTHPAIIDRETWAAAQLMPRTKRRANGRCGGEGAALSGLLTCGCCGGPMYAKTINKWDSYLCSSYTHKRKCGCCHVPRGPMLHAVADKIRKFVLMGSPARLEAAIQRQLDQRREHAPDDGATRRKMATLDRQIERAAGRILVVDDSLVVDVEAQLLALKEQRAKLADSIEAKPAPRLSAKLLAAKMWELDRILTTAPATTIRHALSQLIDHIRLDFREVAHAGRRRRYEFTGGMLLLSQEGQQGAVPSG